MYTDQSAQTPFREESPHSPHFASEERANKPFAIKPEHPHLVLDPGVETIISLPTMYDTYTHTETCTQSFKDHLRTHLASRKQSLSSGATFANPGSAGVVSNVSNLSSAETLKPVDAPNCVCGSPIKNESERLYAGELAGETKSANGPVCACARRVTVIGTEAPQPLEAKKSLKTKALDLLCSACTGYVAKPRAGGFYPDAE